MKKDDSSLSTKNVRRFCLELPKNLLKQGQSSITAISSPSANLCELGLESYTLATSIFSSYSTYELTDTSYCFPYVVILSGNFPPIIKVDPPQKLSLGCRFEGKSNSGETRICVVIGPGIIRTNIIGQKKYSIMKIEEVIPSVYYTSASFSDSVAVTTELINFYHYSRTGNGEKLAREAVLILMKRCEETKFQVVESYSQAFSRALTSTRFAYELIWPLAFLGKNEDKVTIKIVRSKLPQSDIHLFDLLHSVDPKSYFSKFSREIFGVKNSLVCTSKGGYFNILLSQIFPQEMKQFRSLCSENSLDQFTEVLNLRTIRAIFFGGTSSSHLENIRTDTLSAVHNYLTIGSGMSIPQKFIDYFCANNSEMPLESELWSNNGKKLIGIILSGCSVRDLGAIMYRYPLLSYGFRPNKVSLINPFGKWNVATSSLKFPAGLPSPQTYPINDYDEARKSFYRSSFHVFSPEGAVVDDYKKRARDPVPVNLKIGTLNLSKIVGLYALKGDSIFGYEEASAVVEAYKEIFSSVISDAISSDNGNTIFNFLTGLTPDLARLFAILIVRDSLSISPANYYVLEACYRISYNIAFIKKNGLVGMYDKPGDIYNLYGPIVAKKLIPESTDYINGKFELDECREKLLEINNTKLINPSDEKKLVVGGTYKKEAGRIIELCSDVFNNSRNIFNGKLSGMKLKLENQRKLIGNMENKIDGLLVDDPENELLISLRRRWLTGALNNLIMAQRALPEIEKLQAHITRIETKVSDAEGRMRFDEAVYNKKLGDFVSGTFNVSELEGFWNNPHNLRMYVGKDRAISLMPGAEKYFLVEDEIEKLSDEEEPEPVANYDAPQLLPELEEIDLHSMDPTNQENFDEYLELVSTYKTIYAKSREITYFDFSTLSAAMISDRYNSAQEEILKDISRVSRSEMRATMFERNTEIILNNYLPIIKNLLPTWYAWALKKSRYDSIVKNTESKISRLATDRANALDFIMSKGQRETYLLNLEKYIKILGNRETLESLMEHGPEFLQSSLRHHIDASEVWRLKSGRKVSNLWLTVKYSPTWQNVENYLADIVIKADEQFLRTGTTAMPPAQQIVNFKETVVEGGVFKKALLPEFVKAQSMTFTSGNVIVTYYYDATSALLCKIGEIKSSGDPVRVKYPTVLWRGVIYPGVDTIILNDEQEVNFGVSSELSFRYVFVGKGVWDGLSLPLLDGDEYCILGDLRATEIGINDENSSHMIELVNREEGVTKQYSFDPLCALKKICALDNFDLSREVAQKLFQRSGTAFKADGCEDIVLCEDSVLLGGKIRMSCLIEEYYNSWAAFASVGVISLQEQNIILRGDIVSAVEALHENNVKKERFLDLSIINGASKIFNYLQKFQDPSAVKRAISHNLTVLPIDRMSEDIVHSKSFVEIPAHIADFQRSLISNSSNGVAGMTVSTNGAGEYIVESVERGPSDIVDFLQTEGGGFFPVQSALNSSYGNFIGPLGT